MRPSYFRIPTDGWSSIAANVDEIPTVIGPLSKDIDGIELFMKVVTEAKPWLTEPALLPLTWTPFKVLDDRPLRIAIMWHDDVVLPHPPITRALKTVKAKLKAMPNVSITSWVPYKHDEGWAIISSLYYPDGGDEDLNLIAKAGEPVLPLTKWIIQENPCVKKLTMGELQYWKEEREAYRKEYANVWNNTATENNQPVDAILCPVGPGLAPKHQTAKYWGYTSQWNLLDYPAMVFPVCKAHADIDVKERDTEPMSDVDKSNWDLCRSISREKLTILIADQISDHPETFDGVPVALQLVCRRYEDEKVVGIVRHLQKHLNFPFEPIP